jgi:hypothetical protein
MYTKVEEENKKKVREEKSALNLHIKPGPHLFFSLSFPPCWPNST